MIDVEIISSRTTFALKLSKGMKSNITRTKRNLRASLCTAQQHPGKPPSWIDSYEYPLIKTLFTAGSIKYTRKNSGELSESDYCSGLPGRKKAGRWNGQSALGPMCDAEKDWHERSFRASGAINGCQKSPLDKPEMTFSFFIFKLPVTSF